MRKGSDEPALGVVIQLYRSDFQNEMLQHLARECLERGAVLRFYHTSGEGSSAHAFEQIQGAPRGEKILIFGDNGGQIEHLHAAIEEMGRRAVVVDALAPRFRGDYVGTDSEAAVRIGVAHLRGLGHERIALLVNEPAHIETVRLKVAAFKALRECEHGLDGVIVDCGTARGESSFEAAYQKMDALWTMSPRPTAIFTASDPGAWAALKWLAEHKIEVPREVSVLGFEGVRPSAWTHPALSTVAHPLADLARAALDMLWQNQSGQRFLSPHLVLRNSTGPAPTSPVREAR